MARDGSYPRAIQADVSESRLERFFRADDDHYRIDAAVRDHIVFAVHNVLRDPPFSKLHLVSCRNLLIYLDRDLQEEVIAVFRYACREHAYLFLGASEMASEDLFRSLDGKHRIFATVERPEGRPPLPDMLAGAGPATIRAGREIRVVPRSSAAEVHLAALEEASPPSVLIDDRWNVQHLSPSASRFFQQAGGAPARRLTDLVRPELRDELHAVLHRAFDASGPQLSPFVAVRFNGAAHQIAVLAQPHSVREDGSAFMLVTFLNAGEARHAAASGEPQPTDAVVRDLRERLRQAEQRIESMRDDHFLTNEDLRAANEELQSLNEEYRSTTEELETSKEELQSINEELQTVNHELKLKLEEVSRTHADLQNFVGAANVAMLFLDRELRIKRFTPTLLQIFNIRPRDLDRPIRDLTHALDYQTLEEDARTVLASPNATPLERETRSRAGQVFIVRLSPYQTADQREIEGVVATFIEITAIKHAEAALRESERQLAVELELMRRLHRMTLEVATAASTQDALRYILAAAIELHRADLGNVQLLDQASQTLRIVAYDGFGPAFLKRFATVDEQDESGCGRAMRERSMVQISDVLQDPNYMAYRGVAVDAGYRALQSTPLLGRSGELVGVLSVHFREPHVFSERDQQLGDLLSHEAAELIIGRRQQDELVHLNEDLSRRTTELETSQHRLADQAAELVEQDRHREEFLAALGHELRNPLGAIVNSVALLSAPDDRSRRALAVLQRQVRHMTRLVNDLLDITRVKHGRLRLERTVVDLNACVLAVLEAERARAEAKGLQLDYDGPSDAMYADADPERLTQILGNLVSNAVTYTDAGRVLVTVRSENDHVRISVRDTGIGIDPGTAEGLFKPYHQRDQVRGRGGLGLGLALVKSLVEAHGGTITVHSAGHNTGSEFSFTIPHGQAAPVAAPLPRVQTVSRQILVVDDQEDVADSLAGILETLGQQVTVAYSGEAALAAVRNQRPEIAFLDLSMPGMGGAELARRLRQQFPSNGLILIALTGLSKEVATAQGGGFDRHVLKPATPESIAMLLDELNRQANGA